MFPFFSFNIQFVVSLFFFPPELQTVGEEYVNIIQTDVTLKALPSKWVTILIEAKMYYKQYNTVYTHYK